jgi:hypothetical protein
LLVVDDAAARIVAVTVLLALLVAVGVEFGGEELFFGVVCAVMVPTTAEACVVDVGTRRGVIGRLYCSSSRAFAALLFVSLAWSPLLPTLPLLAVLFAPLGEDFDGGDLKKMCFIITFLFCLLV